jgi:hypothetical protein
MKKKDKVNSEILDYLQDKIKFNFNDLQSTKLETLKSKLKMIEILHDSFEEFFDYYFVSKSNPIKVKVFNKEEADYQSRMINSNDVFGRLPCGWIIGRKLVHFYFGNDNDFSMTYSEMANVEWVNYRSGWIKVKSTCSFKGKYGNYIGIPCDLMESHKFFFEDILNEHENWQKEIQPIKFNLQRHINSLIQANLSLSKNSYLNNLDQDANGEIDLVENGFYKLLNKNQKTIISVDKNYIHQFVKVSNFIKTKKLNTQKIFESIRDTSSQEELEERVALLKNQIHSYELLVFHSINMIGALVSEDLITFYEIYESFDKLSMFNSNWENEVSEELTNIGNKLDDLMYSIYNMEQNIVSELSHLSYVTQESFEDLNRSVTNQLREVESSINTNNLLTGIQAYQLYRINKNTKGLRS